jgi:hypothetical protein
MSTTKDQLIKMFVNNTLFSFLMKQNRIKKGDLVCYGKMLDITLDDVRAYFENNGYPGLNIPHKTRPTSSDGSEGDTVWTFKDGVYAVWYIERNIPVEEFSTTSKEDFEGWWKEHIMGVWEYKLNNEWKF